ncbi:energy transducer TonB [Henriciella marina]|uniref:Energy transducer TonB n=1 Tax=Henriciella marina TaxID=453851 RepID=A0ABT4LSG9_9PROT|nr:energy transducer TonB [Henriciella marina]MCZ4297275.1 energy transducer TonB [Henriciella marina]
MQKSIASALILLGALCAPALAEISDEAVARYNAAAQANDVPALLTAAEVLAGEAVASPDDRDAALLAFEAAWALCRNGECEAALAAAEFAASQPDTSAHPSLADRELLKAFAHWQVRKRRSTRADLDTALSTRVEGERTLLSVAAFQRRYLDDAKQGRSGRLPKSAGEAAAHFYPVRDQIGDVWAQAAILAVATEFGTDHTPATLLKMARVEAEILLIRHVTDDEPDWMERRYLEATAWRNAMDAYLRSENKGADEREFVEEILDDAITDDNHQHPVGTGPHIKDDPLLCRGNFTRMPRPTYPDDAAWSGYIGAVIVLFDVDEDGAKNVRIGASVPTDIFDDAALASVRRLKWEWEGSTRDGESCLQQRDSVQWPFYFVLE